MNFKLSIALLLFLPLQGLAQLLGKNNTAENPIDSLPEKSDIYIFVKSTPDGLKVRWAPSNPETWLYGNKYGYVLEKHKILPTDNLELELLETQKIKAWPLENWEAIVTKETPYRAAAAMALYGKTESPPGFVQAAQELENKFSFALLSADLDNKAAEASGLYFFDKSAKINDLFAYKIYILDSLGLPVSDTLMELIYVSKPRPINAPKLIVPDENELFVTLKWEKYGLAQLFSAYHVERSEDGGKTWEVRTKSPYLDVATNLTDEKSYITYMDSVSKNYFPYQYRIQGIDAFGDKSTYSNAISAMGKDKTPPPAVQNLTAAETKENHIILKWEHKDELKEVTKFRVYRATGGEETSLLISPDLPTSTRSFTDKSPNPIATNYYTVYTVDKEGNEAPSIVVFGITTDTKGPAAPRNLRAKVDTLGGVLLEWDAPLDKDIRGYQVLYSNSEAGPFAVKPGDYLPNNYFVDKLTLNTLTEEIFYYVLAIDRSFNVSQGSEVLKVKKPDIIPPSPSIFTDYYVSEEGISFKWNKSTSEDVQKVELKRKTPTSDWQTVPSFDQTKRAFLDKTVSEGVAYQYSLWTIDDDENVTKSEKPLSLTALKSFYLKETPKLTGISTKEGVQLSITYANASNIEFKIYRANADGKLLTYKIIKGLNTFLDANVEKKKTYTYAVVAMAADGRESKISTELKVTFQ